MVPRASTLVTSGGGGVKSATRTIDTHCRLAITSATLMLSERTPQLGGSRGTGRGTLKLRYAQPVVRLVVVRAVHAPRSHRLAWPTDPRRIVFACMRTVLPRVQEPKILSQESWVCVRSTFFSK